MKHRKFAVGSLGLLLFGCSSRHGAVLFNLPAVSSAPLLTVSCSSFQNNAIPVDYSSYGKGLTPTLTWSSPPAGTQEVLLIVEDPDAPGSSPFVHWILAMPGSPTSVPAAPEVGLNSDGKAAYYPPSPPDSKAHHYHFEVFALGKTLAPGTPDRDAVLAALGSGVLAKGELVATFTKP